MRQLFINNFQFISSYKMCSRMEDSIRNCLSCGKIAFVFIVNQILRNLIARRDFLITESFIVVINCLIYNEKYGASCEFINLKFCWKTGLWMNDPRWHFYWMFMDQDISCAIKLKLIRWCQSKIQMWTFTIQITFMAQTISTTIFWRISLSRSFATCSHC